MGSGHSSHAMILDCVIVDVQKDQDGDDFSNIAFKFKNTYSNDKQVEIDATSKFVFDEIQGLDYYLGLKILISHSDGPSRTYKPLDYE